MDEENGRLTSTGHREPFGGSGLQPFIVLAVFGMMYGVVVASVLSASPAAVTVVKFVAPIFAIVGIVAGAWYGFFFNISNHCIGGRLLCGIIGGLGAASVGTLAASLVMAIVGTVGGFATGWIVGSFLKGERGGKAPLIGGGVGAAIQAGWADPATAVQAGALGGVVGAIAGPVFLLLCFGLGYLILRKTGSPRRHSTDEHGGDRTMPTTKKTISQVFEEFLSDQEARLSPKTLSKYESIISLFESYLESYWPGHDQEEYNRITQQGGTFCGTFGPEEIPDGYGEFLGYFMPHKVVCGKDTMKAAGTVTNKLAKWLAEKGYVEDASDAEERAEEAARDLPAAQDVLDLLEQYVDVHAPDKYEDEIEDHFSIKKIEPGKLWLEPFTMFDKVIGPVPVPREVTDICQEMWDIGGLVVKTKRGWRLLEVWNVSP